VRVGCAIAGQGLTTIQTNGTYIHSYKIKPFKTESNLSKMNQTLPEASFEVHQIIFSRECKYGSSPQSSDFHQKSSKLMQSLKILHSLRGKTLQKLINSLQRQRMQRPPPLLLHPTNTIAEKMKQLCHACIKWQC
jgi:hypothetical protein